MTRLSEDERAQIQARAAALIRDYGFDLAMLEGAVRAELEIMGAETDALRAELAQARQQQNQNAAAAVLENERAGQLQAKLATIDRMLADELAESDRLQAKLADAERRIAELETFSKHKFGCEIGTGAGPCTCGLAALLSAESPR